MIKDLLGEEIDYVKVEKLILDVKYELLDVKVLIVVFLFIFLSVVKYSVDGDLLFNEF